MIPNFRAIVPAGGAGTRLWPTSRASNPKFLHSFTGQTQSLLQTTVDRLGEVAEEVIVVTGSAHAAVVQEQVPACGVLTEPSPKDSMPAIALAAAVLHRRYPREELIVGSFAADHVISRVDNFYSALDAAVTQAREGDIVTIGITPTHPSTAYGYIHPGEPLDEAGVVQRAQEFVEKPDADVAQAYVEQGYVWNAGMYVAQARVLLEHLQQLHPELASVINQVAAAWDGPTRAETLERLWPTIEGISIDHAIAEPLAGRGKVAVVRADLGWNDVGDWDAVAAINTGDPEESTVMGEPERATIIDSPGAMVAPRKQVVVVGVPGAVVIETDDAILVTTRDRAQEVKKAVDELRARGKEELL